MKLFRTILGKIKLYIQTKKDDEKFYGTFLEKTKTNDKSVKREKEIDCKKEIFLTKK